MTKTRQFFLRVFGTPLPNFLGVDFPPTEADIVRHWLWVDDSRRGGKNVRLKKKDSDNVIQTVVTNLFNYWKTSHPNCVLKSKHYITNKVKALIEKAKSLAKFVWYHASEPWLSRREKMFKNAKFNISSNPNFLQEIDQGVQSDSLNSETDVSNFYLHVKERFDV